MSDPTWVQAPRLAGDWSDDDGQVISDLVTTEAAPPDPFPAAAVPIPQPSPAPRRISRLYAGFFTFDANTVAGFPQLVCPDDIDRQLFKLSVRRTGGAAGNAFVLLAEEKGRMTNVRPDGSIPNFGEGARMYEGGTFDVSEHTGALWATLGVPLSGTDQLVISWVAVTGGPPQ